MQTQDFSTLISPADRPLSMADRYRSIRIRTEEICKPLSVEDYVIQSMEDVSPTKWHLAHTTWFFETFVLREFDPSYVPLNEQYAYLFNSYYLQAGQRFSRGHRGLLSRPRVDEIFAYRKHVDDSMVRLLSEAGEREDVRSVVEIGLNHEQQHQELMVTDIKHVLSVNPLLPTYRELQIPAHQSLDDLTYTDIEEGICEIGHSGDGFSYDNEGPRHRQFLEPYRLAQRPVSNGEYLGFVNDGGYQNSLYWLSEGWNMVQEHGWQHPLYWLHENDEWSEFSLYGKISLIPDAPLTHVSYFEADAYARWSGARLPTEFEWENVAQRADVGGHFSDTLLFHPRLEVKQAGGFLGLFGSSWEWTSSHYSPYPRYQPGPGALGEYNGKFMSNQFVLRGGSCATPSDHIRPSYRNFFPSGARWQFSGIRLAQSIE